MSFLGNNLKVHFAGADGGETTHIALEAADIKYRLYSCFPYIDKKRALDDFTLRENHIIKVQDKEMNHVIQVWRQLIRPCFISLQGTERMRINGRKTIRST